MFEDIAIASYLMCLWESEPRQVSPRVLSSLGIPILTARIQKAEIC